MRARMFLITIPWLLCAAPVSAMVTPSVPNPCTGPSGLLAELDRPTVADSACVAEPGRAIVEMGYAHLNTNAGTRQNLPQAELRFGLPRGNEFVFLPPNATYAGNEEGGETDYSATVMGLKHEWGYTRRWIYTGEVLFTAPGTRNADGTTDGWGTAINGIVGYSLTSRVAFGLMLGVTSLYDEAGRRYTSVNPDFTATWLVDPRWQLYAEFYGQTHTAQGAGSGWDTDGGVQYLVTRDIEVDAEIGQRLYGALGGYRHYWGVGAGWEF
ncbi:transporter [Acidiferrobacter sp.]|uniref:transporter n=1 Tax=Acidiferrobacter sp. TaxID=1872107 RepID=UPI002630C188|nr:transporter [Acidiferrobacter sp.]